MEKLWLGEKPPVLLCHPLNVRFKERIKFPAFVETKADGARIYAILQDNEVSLVSRQGKVYTGLTQLEETLKKLQVDNGFTDVVLDGELRFTDAEGNYLPRQITSGLVNKSIKKTISVEEGNRAVISLWDCIHAINWSYGYDSTFYVDRREMLDSCLDLTGITNINTILPTEVNSWKETFHEYNKRVESGEEGVIIKNKYHVWQNHRSPHCLKIKPEKTIDLRILFINEGEGKAEGMMGSLYCESDNRKIRVKVGTGFNDAMRQWFWENQEDLLGAIVEIKYNYIISAKDREFDSLFLPVYLFLREDKIETD